MLPKKYHLSVTQFYKNPNLSQKFASANISFLIKTSNIQQPRFAVLILKAVDKRSTKRHKIKRFIEEHIYKKAEQIKSYKEVVIKVGPYLKDSARDFLLLENTLANLWQKSQLLRETI